MNNLHRIALLLFLLLPFPAAGQEISPIKPIRRTFGEIELGDYVNAGMICSSFGVPSIYKTVSQREASSIRIPIGRKTYYAIQWDEVVVDYLNDENSASAILFMKTEKEVVRLLQEYDSLKRTFETEYGPVEETSSYSGSSISCLWSDERTVLMLILSREDAEQQHTLKLCFSDKS